MFESHVPHNQHVLFLLAREYRLDFRASSNVVQIFGLILFIEISMNENKYNEYLLEKTKLSTPSTLIFDGSVTEVAILMLSSASKLILSIIFKQFKN